MRLLMVTYLGVDLIDKSAILAYLLLLLLNITFLFDTRHSV